MYFNRKKKLLLVDMANRKLAKSGEQLFGDIWKRLPFGIQSCSDTTKRLRKTTGILLKKMALSFVLSTRWRWMSGFGG